MFSIHYFRWTKQLKNSGHEIFWIDVFDSDTFVKELDFVEQTIGWRNKIKYPGRYLLKEKSPIVYSFINKFNETKLTDILEEKIEEIQPDVVQSFILQSAAYPILDIMRRHPQIKWVYSAWGNDLFFRQQNEMDLENIKATLPNIDYMFADCKRDHEVAQKYGFKGEYLGTFPTGGGYELDSYNPSPFEEKNIIIIKGYQSKLGRCNSVLEAITGLKTELSHFKIVVFGANEQVWDFCVEKGLDAWKNFQVMRHISHKEVLELMGQSLVYVGNSISDGMPNTLLEAIIMEAFPIQSNPGGATAEIIEHGKNGFLIENPEDSDEIAGLIKRAIENPQLMKSAIDMNIEKIKPNLEREVIKEQVLEKYHYIQENL